MAELSTLVQLATVVDGEALLDTAIASVVAGVGVTAAASTAIYGFATFTEARSEERMAAAAVGAAIGIAASLVFLAAIVAGLIVMVS